LRIEIDPSSPTPPSEQVANQVRFAVSAGRLRPGDRLPSVRGLAVEARINPNTVSRAYRTLEREGTVRTRPGAGVYVARQAEGRCAEIRDRWLRDQLGRIVADALTAGLGPADLERVLADLVRGASVEAA
jgi:GntR family transcriptional regulator